MTRLRSLYERWYAEGQRPVGRFTQFDLDAVALGIGMLATWGVLAFGGLL